MKKAAIWLLCVLLILCSVVTVTAEETPQAEDISASAQFSGTGYKGFGFLKDKDIYTYGASEGNASITIESDTPMGSLYILFDLEYGPYTITDNVSGNTITGGENYFVHEFIDLAEAFGYAPNSLTLDFANGSVHLSEIYVFSEGRTPDFVQKWEPPLDGCADLLLMPTHGDDDQLYFAGLLPYYAGELDCAVQVAYLTNHRNYTTIRVHEMLNGLWATGVENYPVFAYKLDFRIDDLEKSYNTYEKVGITREDLVGFAVEMFRRFKPQVVVGHDVFGEYGHGMHLVYADIIMKGVELSYDPQAYPESAQQYGTWDVPKTYLHLLEDNPIVIDYDVPLEHFDGLTAFQVTQKYGFPCHESQHVYRAFGDWLYGYDRSITKATEIETYNPSYFGLYRSTIGEDVLKNDFLENITTYEEQARIEAERLEQERLEAERLEQERLQAQRLEAQRLEQERLEQEKLAQQEEEKMTNAEIEQLAAQAQKKETIMILILTVVCFVAFSLAARLAKKFLSKRPDLKNKKNF